MHLLPRIARSDPAAGFVTEALAAASRKARGGESAAQGVSGKARAQVARS